MTDLHFRQRWRPGSLRRELVLGEHGLTELLAFGRGRYTPWCFVRDVRWLRGGRAVIDTEAGEPIRLGRNIDDLKALVVAAKERMLADRASDQAQPIGQALVEGWMFAARVGMTARTWRGVRWLLVLGGTGLLAVWGAWLPSFAVGALGLAMVGYGLAMWVGFAGRAARPWPPGASADGLVCEQGRRTIEVAWEDMLGVRWEADEIDPWGRVVLHIDTRRGAVSCTAMALAARTLLPVIQRAVAFNTARLVAAAAPLLSDASLSPSRGTADNAGRGLSQAERSVAP